MPRLTNFPALRFGVISGRQILVNEMHSAQNYVSSDTSVIRARMIENGAQIFFAGYLSFV